MIRVLLVDDDPLVRSGLALILGGEADIEIVGHAANGADALAQIPQCTPDLVLMDIRMPVLDGLETTERLSDQPNAPKVIVLTTFGADEYVVRALTAGASGFLLKDTPPENIVSAIRRVVSGEAMLSPPALAGLIRQVTARESDDTDRPSDRSREAQQRLQGLTERELDVAIAVGNGMSNAAIASALFLSVPTVKAHIGRVFQKLGVENRVQVAICVHDAGLV